MNRATTHTITQEDGSNHLQPPTIWSLHLLGLRSAAYKGNNDKLTRPMRFKKLSCLNITQWKSRGRKSELNLVVGWSSGTPAPSFTHSILMSPPKRRAGVLPSHPHCKTEEGKGQWEVTGGELPANPASFNQPPPRSHLTLLLILLGHDAVPRETSK